MNSQFPPLNNQEDQQQQQQQPKQQPPPQQNTIQQYPIFYIKPNTFPIPNNQQQHTIDHYNSWFVCHPVMPDDPYLSYLSQLSNIIQKPQTFQNEVPIKLEVDEVIVKPLIQNQANQLYQDKPLKQQRLQQLQNQTKIKKTDHAIGSNIQPCKCSQIVLKYIVNVFKVEESAWMNVNALIARIVHNFHMKESQQLIRNFKEIFQVINSYLNKIIMAVNVDPQGAQKNIVNASKKDKNVQSYVLVKIAKIFHLVQVVKMK